MFYLCKYKNIVLCKIATNLKFNIICYQNNSMKIKDHNSLIITENNLIKLTYCRIIFLRSTLTILQSELVNIAV